MTKFLTVYISLVALILMLSTVYAAPLESAAPEAESDDLSTADSIGVGYYVPTYSSYYSPSYYGGYGYGGYGGYGYGGYRSYGRVYRRPIYPVWG